MMRLQRIACLLSLALLPFSASLRAAEPSGGDLGSPQGEVTWTGTPLAPNPAACPTSGDPACDHFRLTISSPAVKRVFIAIAPAAGFEADDYDLFVYDPAGTLVASDATGDGYESVVIPNTGAAYYEVRVQPFVIGAGSSYTGVAEPTRDQAFEAETHDCLEAIPENIGLQLIDGGQRVELSVFLLLDGTDSARAAAVMARAAESYRPLGVDLVLKGMRAVSLTSPVSEDLINDAKLEFGGKPPRGIDLVGVFTNKTMQPLSGGGATVVGQADCIGGVRYDSRSFFVVSDLIGSENPTTGNGGTLNSLGFNVNVDATAEVMAHEIGHLMGAHHHYANCIEGNLTSAGPNDVSPCTLMFNAVNGASLNFSTLSGAVVRGHAVNHASP